jgi:hypothetical protein
MSNRITILQQVKTLGDNAQYNAISNAWSGVTTALEAGANSTSQGFEAQWQTAIYEMDVWVANHIKSGIPPHDSNQFST